MAALKYIEAVYQKGSLPTRKSCCPGDQGGGK